MYIIVQYFKVNKVCLKFSYDLNMYIGTMAVSSLMISSCFTYGFILAVMFSFTGADVTVIQGKIQDPPITRFSVADRGIQLICNPKEFKGVNITNLKWTLIKSGKIAVDNAALSCMGHSSTEKDSDEDENDDDIHQSLLVSDCAVKLSGNSSLILDIDDIISGEFGDYVCHTGNMSFGNLTIHLREIVHLYRKNEKGKMIRSVTVNAGDPLYLYCNHTGLNSEKHEVSWWRDGENITEELKNGIGMFENFTVVVLEKQNDKPQPDYLSFEGTALLEHRGNYTCQVDLKERLKESHLYPVHFSYFVRVKEGTEWQLPVYILLGQCALIGLFTLIVNIKEKRMEESDYPVEDSEDEDEVQPAKSNGTQNNNGHGK